MTGSQECRKGIGAKLSDTFEGFGRVWLMNGAMVMAAAVTRRLSADGSCPW